VARYSTAVIAREGGSVNFFTRNLPGDEKAVPVIEDTAVDVYDLPAYIRDFNEILKKYDLTRYIMHMQVQVKFIYVQSST
jgi:FAD/FMN-containing dehydrogenase